MDNMGISCKESGKSSMGHWAGRAAVGRLVLPWCELRHDSFSHERYFENNLR